MGTVRSAKKPVPRRGRHSKPAAKTTGSASRASKSTVRNTTSTARSTRANGRATVETLLRHGREELERVGAVDFNLERVLRRSKISQSSLYHHFSSREGFVVALEFENSYRRQMNDMELMRGFLLATSSREKVMQSVEFALAVAGNDDGRMRRQRRIGSLAAAGQSRQLRKMLAEAQVAGSRHFAETIRMATERGIVRTDLPIDGISYVIQSLFLGRILADLADDPQVDRDWVTTSMSVIRHLLS